MWVCAGSLIQWDLASGQQQVTVMGAEGAWGSCPSLAVAPKHPPLLVVTPCGARQVLDSGHSTPITALCSGGGRVYSGGTNCEAGCAPLAPVACPLSVRPLIAHRRGQGRAARVAVCKGHPRPSARRPLPRITPLPWPPVRKFQCDPAMPRVLVAPPPSLVSPAPLLPPVSRLAPCFPWQAIVKRLPRYACMRGICLGLDPSHEPLHDPLYESLYEPWHEPLNEPWHKPF